MTAPISRSGLGSGARGRYENDEISFLTLGAVLLEQRWRLARWAFLGGLVAVLSVFFKGLTWTASASFVPQGADPAVAGIRSLAGQLGVSIPVGGASATESPQFYADLLTSRVILSPIVNDTLLVAEEGAEPRAVLELLAVGAPELAALREEGIKALREWIKTSVARTGVLTVSVTTAWPSVSLAIAERVLDEVNRFNLHSRQSQAAAERRFVEERLAAQRRALAGAEGRLGAFLEANRQFRNSPNLTFEFDRLQREVALQQEVLVALAQAHEEARIREVRDVPVITVIESPILPARPDPRGRLLRGILGVLLGGFLGLLVAFTREMFTRRRAEGDEEAARFASLLGEMRGDLTRWMGRRRRPSADVLERP